MERDQLARQLDKESQFRWKPYDQARNHLFHVNTWSIEQNVATGAVRDVAHRSSAGWRFRNTSKGRLNGINKKLYSGSTALGPGKNGTICGDPLGHFFGKEADMNKPLRRLGRGLDSLISRPVEDAPVQSNPLSTAPTPRPVPISGDTAAGPVQTSLPLDALVPNPFQPRSEANQAEIESLAASIKHSGMLQPISVRFHNGRYEIIAGERRWHAARQCGMAAVPVSIRKATDEQMLELALVENLQRQDLNAIDRARAYQEFCQRFNLPVDELAIRLAEDRSTVANYIRLLDLPRDVQAMVSKGDLSMGQARAIVAVRDPAKQLELAKTATSKQLSVRAVEELVRNLQKSDNIKRDGVHSGDRTTAHIRDLERRFEEALKTRVSIKEGRRKGSGRLVIEYFSIDDFDRIAEALGVALE